MTSNPVSVTPAAPTVATPGRFAGVLRGIVRDPLAVLGLLFLLAVALAALAPGLLSPHDPLARNLDHSLEGPSRGFWLGTDLLGRDTFSRLVYSSRSAVLAGLEATGIALVIGVPVGLAAGFFGGWFDKVTMRIVDAVTALPGMIIAIAVIAAIGPGVVQAMFALGLIFSTTFVRVTRGEVLVVREQQYVEAAHVTGVPWTRILGRHVLPNIMGPLVVQTSLTMAAALLAEAALSFLGLSAQPPTATWGVMVAQGGTLISQQPFLIIPPGLAIGLTVLSLNLVGDALLGVLRGEPRQLGRRLRQLAGPGVGTTVAVPPTSSAQVVENGPRRVGGAGGAQAPLFDVRGLGVSYLADTRTVQIIEDVSFSVHAGETLGLVGESGSGKTITALATMGLLPHGMVATSGSVRLEGQELLGLRERDLNGVRGDRIAMVFQEPSSALNPAFTIGNQITEALRTHQEVSRKEARIRAIDLLQRVGIREPQHRIGDYPHELSGGMAQRAMVALAISCDPVLLIADEPTTALDVTLKRQIGDLLLDLQDESKMAMIFVTHELGMIAQLADRVAVMYAGEVVEECSVETMFASPSHPYTAALIESARQDRPRGTALEVIPGGVPVPGSWPDACRFAPRCAAAVPACTTASVPLVETPDGRARCIRVEELLQIESRGGR
ncbi:dipeptide/oligopeptide/nickel ABC transporter permease/ATP-binding protein [Nocardioides alcanivorans]|uniref:dipeptide/oligopeptide/nickel ABC transporter permease/ATP-binding protein n=1 Tax=Nocardioides alcanivorans TaxID=2897352 RepID=UPI001F423030|nr:dipeptide/oligopeptide/nickel ABC transporter permease/ATP-binding protein [Nocardioides alcanivorans]